MDLLDLQIQLKAIEVRCLSYVPEDADSDLLESIETVCVSDELPRRSPQTQPLLPSTRPRCLEHGVGTRASMHYPTRRERTDLTFDVCSGSPTGQLSSKRECNCWETRRRLFRVPARLR